MAPGATPIPGTEGACQGSLQIVSIALEVDTAVGKGDFFGDLTSAFRNALSAEYTFCTPLRRRRRRHLEDLGGSLADSIELGSILFTEETGGKIVG